MSIVFSRKNDVSCKKNKQTHTKKNRWDCNSSNSTGMVLTCTWQTVICRLLIVGHRILKRWHSGQCLIKLMTFTAALSRTILHKRFVLVFFLFACLIFFYLGTKKSNMTMSKIWCYILILAITHCFTHHRSCTMSKDVNTVKKKTTS